MLALLFPVAALACPYPDEGNMPLRRAVTKVRMLPETEAWSSHMHKTGAIVHYAVLLEEAVIAAGRCYWTVEVRTGDKLWRRFLVTPDGNRIIAKD